MYIKETHTTDMEPAEMEAVESHVMETEAVGPPTYTKPGISLSGLMDDMKLDLPDFGNVSTGELERVCSELEAAQLEDILRK